MDVASTARIFRKLMTRLGYSKYYIQGGDWGSAIATATAVLYPDTYVIPDASLWSSISDGIQTFAITRP